MRETRSTAIAVFFGALAAAQIGVLAIFRAAEVLYRHPASRHQDLLAVGLVGGLLAAIALATQPGRSVLWRRGFAVVWLGVAALGLGREGWTVAFDALPQWRENCQGQTTRLRTFLQTGDFAVLQHRSVWEIGYPDPARLASILELPELREVFPPALHPGVAGFGFPEEGGLRSGAVPQRSGSPAGMTVWGSYGWPGGGGPAATVSAPFEVRRGWIEFTHAVSPEPGPVRFEFVPEAGGAAVALAAWGAPGAVWRQGRIALEPGRYRLRVTDAREGGWLAVAAPRELSRLGACARRLLEGGATLFGVAGIGLALALWWPLRGRRRGG